MWLVDNNVPRQVTQLLRDLGHDVVEVREVLAASAPDAAIAAFARQSDRRGVTNDVGFARACRREGIPTSGFAVRITDMLGEEVLVIDPR